jgi:dihydroneopterin aldolase
MPDRLRIERLEIQAHCGVTEEERQVPQPIAIDLDLDYPSDMVSAAAGTDHLSGTVDYARIVDRIVEIGTESRHHLLERMADRLLTMLFAEFPVTRVRLWARKVSPPLKPVKGSVGVQLDRTRAAASAHLMPAQFLTEQIHRLPRGEALDVAAGHGRNSILLATQGYRVDAVDRDEEALAELARAARRIPRSGLTVHAMDLEADTEPPAWPQERYDVILVFFYLHRPLFPALRHALKPGGMLLYETFLLENHRRYHHPRRKEFCLAPNELLRLADDLTILHYDEGPRPDGAERPPVFTARLLAQRVRATGTSAAGGASPPITHHPSP